MQHGALHSYYQSSTASIRGTGEAVGGSGWKLPVNYLELHVVHTPPQIHFPLARRLVTTLRLEAGSGGLPPALNEGTPAPPTEKDWGPPVLGGAPNAGACGCCVPVTAPNGPLDDAPPD